MVFGVNQVLLGLFNICQSFYLTSNDMLKHMFRVYPDALLRDNLLEKVTDNCLSRLSMFRAEHMGSLGGELALFPLDNELLTTRIKK